MASTPGRAPPPSSPSLSAKSAQDPILRNALRYTISAREYATLHKYILSRSRLLKKRAPSVDTVNRIMHGSSGKGAAAADKEKEMGGASRRRDGGLAGADDFNARAVRHALRVFAGTAVAMKLYDAVMQRIAKKSPDSSASKAGKHQPLYKSKTFRLSLSLSTILLLYRLLFRFLTRLRLHLLDPSVAPFRNRNPRTASALTSPYAPAVGASLAGLALGVYPAQQMRVGIALFALFRALEFGWNCAEDNGMVWGTDPKTGRMRRRPWWWGSWMLQPLAFGQLLHATVIDPDCAPPMVGSLMSRFSQTYLHDRPAELPVGQAWPGFGDVLGAVAGMAHLAWPSFVSPTLLMGKQQTLPASVAAVAPLTNMAHPLITNLSCAALHPSDPSCLRTYLTFWLNSFPPFARFFLLVYGAMSVPRLGQLYHFPLSTLHAIFARALRSTTFATGALSTAWASLCFFQAWLPRRLLATRRIFLGGFLAGFWAWIERRAGRPVFLYTARASVDSLWKVGAKRRWWRAMQGGDVWVFVLAVMLTGVVYERDARALREQNWRKGISWVRGEGWRDWAIEEDDEEDEAGRREDDDDVLQTN